MQAPGTWQSQPATIVHRLEHQEMNKPFFTYCCAGPWAPSDTGSLLNLHHQQSSSVPNTDSPVESSPYLHPNPHLHPHGNDKLLTFRGPLKAQPKATLIRALTSYHGHTKQQKQTLSKGAYQIQPHFSILPNYSLCELCMVLQSQELCKHTADFALCE